MLPSTSWIFAAVSLLSCVVIVQSEPIWQSLQVTWGLDVLNPWVFAKLPQTESQARSEGFVRLAGECSGGKFLGRRYMKGLDTTAVVIYDVNGYIAGIQHGIPKNDVKNLKNTSISFNHFPAYQLDNILVDKEVYFLTTYFVDLDKICNGGRTREEYEEQGIGTGLHLQSGNNPVSDYVVVPLYQRDIENTEWVKGGCFNTMGLHYWFKTHENMSCSNYVPFTAIYNKRKLTSFAFSSFGNYEFSRRFEHAQMPMLSLTLPSPAPKCVSEEFDRWGGMTLMHVFFTARPLNNMC